MGAIAPSHLGSTDPDIDRAPQRQHAVEHVNSASYLSRWLSVLMSPQPIANHPFPSTNCRLRLGTPGVARDFLRTHAAVFGHTLEMPVALRRVSSGCLAQRRGRARRHNDRGLRVPFGQTGVDTFLI